MWISDATCELGSPSSALPAMEGAMGEGEQPDLHQTNQRDEAELKNVVPYGCNPQLNQDLERAEHQRYVANMECVSGQRQAVLGRNNHHLLCKEEDTKVCKRQKTFNGPHNHGPINTSFNQRRNGQEIQAPAFGHNIQSSNMDPRMGQHHDTVRLARNVDYHSIHPGALTVHNSPPALEHSEPSLDCSHQNGPKSMIRDSCNTQGIRTIRVQADHNSITNRGQTIGLHADHNSSIQESRKNRVQADHCSNQASRTTWLQLDHNSSLIHESRVTGLYAELVKELEAQLTELRKLLASQDETLEKQDRRIKELEYENQKLKDQMRTLEEQNDLLSSRNEMAARARRARMLVGPANDCIDVTESNIQFLKGLVGFLESNAGSQINGRIQLPPLVPAPEPKMPPAEVRVSPFMPQAPREELKPVPAEVQETSPVGMLRVSGVTGGFQYWMNAEESSGSPAPLNESCSIWEETIQETLPDGTPAWASPVEENGRPKLELIPNSGVYITHHQLDDLSQISNEKPKLMTRRLLDYFFSRETLARSSATGQRIAHNNTTMEKPIRLPVAVVSAIKEYVTNVCGRGCNFNAVINSKCGTSRRAVKKMSIRIDWTEGSGQHCPRTEVITDGSLSPCRRAISMLQNTESCQASTMQMDEPTYS